MNSCVRVCATEVSADTIMSVWAESALWTIDLTCSGVRFELSSVADGLVVSEG